MTEYIEKQSALSLVSCVGERRMTSSAPYYLGYHDAVEEIKNALVDMPAKGFSVEFAVDLAQRISNVMPKVLDVIVSDLTLTLDQRDAALREQWTLFEDIPMNPETECIEQPFLSFDAGTHREEIWQWFDKRYSKGVHALLYGEEEQPACPYCSAEWGLCDPITNRFTTPPHGGIKFCPICGRKVGDDDD